MLAEEKKREKGRERKREPRLATAFESSRRHRYFDWERSEVLGQVSTWQVRLPCNGNSALGTYGSGGETKRALSISPQPPSPPLLRHREYRGESFGCE